MLANAGPKYFLRRSLGVLRWKKQQFRPY